MGFTNGPVQAGDGSVARLVRLLRHSWVGAAVLAPEVKPALSRAPPAADPRSGPPCVLVVDDNPVNLLVASEMLAQWGITPLLAADGAEAVALTLELPLELVLMDLQMPVLDGFDATCQIRRFEHEHGRARVPVVAYTMSPHVDVLRLQDCGFDDVLPKPCDERTMLECVQRWCTSMGPWVGKGAARSGPPPHFGAATEPA